MWAVMSDDPGSNGKGKLFFEYFQTGPSEMVHKFMDTCSCKYFWYKRVHKYLETEEKNNAK